MDEKDQDGSGINDSDNNASQNQKDEKKKESSNVAQTQQNLKHEENNTDSSTPTASNDNIPSKPQSKSPNEPTSVTDHNKDNVRDNHQSVSPPDIEETKITEDERVKLSFKGFTDIKDCNTEQIAYIVQHHIIPSLNNDKINNIKDKIISWINEKNIDGDTVSKFTRKAIQDAFEAYSNNKKHRGTIVKLLKPLQRFDFNAVLDVLYSTIHDYVQEIEKDDIDKIIHNESIDKFELEQLLNEDNCNCLASMFTDLKIDNSVWKRIFIDLQTHYTSDVSFAGISNIQQCNSQQIGYICKYHIIPTLNTPEINAIKDKVISWIDTRNIDGNRISTFTRDEFQDELVKYYDGRDKEKIGKLLVSLREFDVNMVNRRIDCDLIRNILVDHQFFIRGQSVATFCEYLKNTIASCM